MILEIIKRNPVLYRLLILIRKTKLVSCLLGRKYSRSRNSIEIDITYECNLNCINCNRMCRQAPSDERMTLEQIRKFIDESIENGIKWKMVRLLGGEPTLHPDVIEMLQLLLEYKKNYSPKTDIQLSTNGAGKFVKEVISGIPEGVTINNTNKQSIINHEFCPMNIAPKDTFARFADFSNGCIVITFCGIGLTRYGYYPCAVAGAIDRVFGFDKGRKKLPLKDDDMYDQLKLFCRLCGHFRQGYTSIKEEKSPTWKKALENYKNNKPVLSLY
ncbi:MAG: hypothetical protein ACD_79C00384G0001 [uncultured bacterium]|nr:MAG: hypothetical protein ACD_79C00384G0001 [uncultured bacterium]